MGVGQRGNISRPVPANGKTRIKLPRSAVCVKTHTQAADGQSHQPIDDPCVLLAASGSGIGVTSPVHLKGLAGMPDTRSPTFRHPSGHPPALRWPRHSF
jgi:hypothetical protein